MRRYPLIVLMILSLASGAAFPATWTVRADGSGSAPTIQAAIDSASTGDGVIVFGGVYHEDGILVDGKDLFIQYSGGTAVVVSSSYRSGTGMTFRNTGAGASLLGFEFREFDRGVSIENGEGMYWYCSIIDCGTAFEVSGAVSAPGIMFCLLDSCGTGVSVIDGSGVNVRNMTIVGAETGAQVLGGSLILTRSIINSCGTGALCLGGSTSLSCNNFYLNGEDYGGCAAGTDDFYGLTRFCFEAGGSPGPYYLHVDSPCWAENNACGVDVGAFTQSPGCTGTAVEESSWGAIKKLHR
jgi:hypothetical protein